MLVGALFLLLYYVGSAVQSAHLLIGLVVALYGLLLVPTLLFVRFRKLDLRSALHVKRPNVLAMVGAGLVGVSAANSAAFLVAVP